MHFLYACHRALGDGLNLSRDRHLRGKKYDPAFQVFSLQQLFAHSGSDRYGPSWGLSNFVACRLTGCHSVVAVDKKLVSWKSEILETEQAINQVCPL